MQIDKSIIPLYLKALRSEMEQALQGESVFSDHNGMVYLSEAIETLEEGATRSVDHTEMRWQVWNAISTLTPTILRTEGLSDENYGKILRLFWTTNFENAIATLQSFKDEEIKPNADSVAQWLGYVLDV